MIAAFMQSLRDFWTAPVTPRPLAWFRIGLSAVLLAQALSLIGHLDDLYGRHGVVDWSVTWDTPVPGVPDLEWLDRALSLAGLPAEVAGPVSFAVYEIG